MLATSAPDANAVGGCVAFDHFHHFTRFQIAPFDEAEELGILIGDALHRDPCVERAGQERIERAPFEHTFRIGDGIAMRIRLRMAQHLVDPFD